MKEAVPAHQKEHESGACMYVDVCMHDNAPIKRLYVACHTDNKPMSLLFTFDTTKDPSALQGRTRAYLDSDGVPQNFVGALRQPNSL